jgi:hypothetical protein
MTYTKDIIREITSRRDPFGYYVLIAVNNDQVHKLIEKYKNRNLITEAVGNILIIRCRSRRTIEELACKLIPRKLLILQNP